MLTVLYGTLCTAANAMISNRLPTSTANAMFACWSYAHGIRDCMQSPCAASPDQ